MAISYCTLTQAETTGKIGNTDGEFEAYYKAVYDRVTKRIDRLTRNTFAPRIETRYYDGYAPDYQHGVLYLNYPLLSITSIVTNATTTIDSADYSVETRDGDPAMTIFSDSGLTFTDNRRNAIAVTGTWGWRSYYDSDGWQSETTLNEGGMLSASDTTITVTSAISIESGDMLRIESELISVTDKIGNDITVVRGIRGSTATTHADSTAVERWIVEPDIANAAAIMIAYAYKRRGDYAQVEFSSDVGVGVSFPADQPLIVTNSLRPYRLGYSKVV